MTTQAIKTGTSARLAARSNTLPPIINLSQIAPGHIHAHILILPSPYTADFRLLCARNPVALPLLAESTKPGIFDAVKSRVAWLEDDEVLLRQHVDLRRDVGGFTVWRDGEVFTDGQGMEDVVSEWKDDHVAFVIASEGSIEAALRQAGLLEGRIPHPPMYRTRKPLFPSGTFYDCEMVVSMRSFSAAETGQVRQVTAPFALAHGEPIDWGWGAVGRLGIRDIDMPEWGERPVTRNGRALGEVAWKDDEVPVFWGSGVTAQEAVAKMELPGTVMANAVGEYLVLDCKDEDVARVS
ncbi:hypothetical protein M409DRAFT_25198 [Zasmidium cellare ATCC 36951]|uniref:Uncharacterized protein n=1 Tax=Zasmidium cellare ATCC 36951 TaxID=1080233 RepID=A0A6A6CF66_ZASCE|nr:uncharacterized protein M409DRAFT_25198 [Zasmidium cellare ATCC 36951]KAF2164319.1 hypothetical protein M409DRAFT_25198 [Zasmidium cellare ATCC 36951]